MSTLKTSWNLWFGWNPVKVEDWLEEMALQGWELYQVDMAGIRFGFKKDQSRKIRYCADYQSKVDDQYLELFQDDGWSLIWSSDMGWYIWRKEYAKERPSIYTDTKSLIERNDRMMKVLTPMFFALVSLFLILVFPRWHNSFFDWMLWLYIGVLSMYGVIFYKIRQHTKRLKNSDIKDL